MEINRARRITGTYIRDGKKTKPFSSTTWSFIKGRNQIFIENEEDPQVYYLSTPDKFVQEFIFNGSHIINDIDLSGMYYLTAIGLVTVDEFMLAEDMMERYSKRIPLEELKTKQVYISDKGEAFFFIDSFKIEMIKKNNQKIYKEYMERENCLYNLNKKIYVPLKIVKLVKEENNQESYEMDFDTVKDSMIKSLRHFNAAEKTVFARLFKNDYLKVEETIHDWTISEDNLQYLIDFSNSDETERNHKATEEEKKEVKDFFNGVSKLMGFDSPFFQKT